MCARQADRKFGELVGPAVDFDGAAVLLGDDSASEFRRPAWPISPLDDEFPISGPLKRIA